jgi:hypothetical protein
MLDVSPLPIVETEQEEREYVGILGGYRLLALTLIETNAAQLRNWSRHWRRWKERFAPERYAAARRRAQEADEWLLDDEPATLRNKLTFVQVCDHLGFDLEEARSQIYSQCEDAALHELWREA